MGSEDMLQLRAFMIGASACGILYNLLQPLPLIPPACWGLFFIAGHTAQIYRILLESQPVAMSHDEHDLYDSVFLPYGFTPRNFAQLLTEGQCKWVEFKPGDLLAVEGDPVRHVAVILQGTVDVLHGEEVCHKIDDEAVRDHHGVWVGHAWDYHESGTANPARLFAEITCI